MPSLILLLLALCFLLLPWLLVPRRNSVPPEIHGHLTVLWWINRLYCALLHKIDLKNEAPLPAHGPAILISNHTCGLDPLVLQAGSHRVLGFMIAQEFYNFWLVRPLCLVLRCIPVLRNGQDLSATRAALRALGEGRVLPIFPEGKILPESGQSFLDPKPGAAFIALHTDAPVIPAYICGTPPTNNVFKALVWPSRARVIFGEPIDLAADRACGKSDKEHLAEVSHKLMDAIKALRCRMDALERQR